MTISSSLHENVLNTSGGHILVRCDSTPSTGLSSIVRCISIAQQLQNRFGFDVTFALNTFAGQEEAIEAIRTQDFRIKIRPIKDKESIWLRNLCTDLNITNVLIDVRTNLDVEGLQALRANGLSVAVLDDVSDRRLVADLAFYSPASQAEALKWYGGETKVLSGWQWVAMSPALSEAGENAVAIQTQALQGAMSDMEHSHLRVLVSFDGNDAQDLTWKTARRLVDLLSERDKVSKSTFDVTFSVDKSAKNGRYTAMRIASLDRRFKVIDTSEDIIAEAAACDMAIVAFGVNAYEMGYLGKPTVLVCRDAEHSEAACAFVQAGIAKRTLADVMGPGRAFNEQVEQWLDHGNARSEAGLKARALIDGGGAYRIAETIATHVAMAPQLEADVA